MRWIAALLLTAPVFAQSGILTGYVNGPDKKGIANAIVSFDRVDIPSHHEVKTDKRGHYQIFTLMNGDYIVSVTVDGEVRDRVPYHVSPGNQNRPLYFFLKRPGEAAASLKAADKLGEYFAAANKALEAKEYEKAVESLTKAVEIDARQDAVLSALAEAYMGLGQHEKAFQAFRKAIEIKPGDARIYNNFALALAAASKLEEAQQNLAKAIEIDPLGAGKYYFNLGVLLLNIGQTEAAAGEFKRALAADPNYAEAQYQYGLSLAMGTRFDTDGKVVVPPGAIAALQRYLELKPDGPNAKSAKEMILKLGGSAK